MDEHIAQTPDEAALQWFVRTRDGGLEAGEKASFAEWLAASPEHERAWRELELIWRDLDGAAPDSVSPAVVPMASTLRGRWRWGGLRAVALAASFLVAALLAMLLAPVAWFADFRTGIGERRVIALSDGSLVELAPASAIDVDLKGGRRIVRLRAGQAFFTVASDPARPFSVEAGRGAVTALGTAFDVKLDEGEAVAVAVDESSVEVRLPGAVSVVVGSGRGVSYDARAISAPNALEPGEIGGWRQDRIVLHDVSLAQAAADLERYVGGHIEVFPWAVARQKVTAVLDARDPQGGLDTLAAGLGLRVLRPLPRLALLLPF